ncbi:MAG: YciI family protein [Pseudomonadota bacterium]
MKMLLLANEAPHDFALRDDGAKYDTYMGAWYAYSAEMKEAGVTLDGAALQPPETATVVSVRDGQRRIEDGPFADAKEQLGGFFVIEAPDLKAGADWAAKCPAAKTGFVDVRVIPSHEEHAK